MAKAQDSNGKTRKKSIPGKKGSTKKSSQRKKKVSPGSAKKGGARQKKLRRPAGWEFLVFVAILVAVGLFAGYYHLYFKPLQKPAESAYVPEKPEPPRLPVKRPMVAIIIDDLGYEREIVEKFLSLDGPFTYAILPRSPFQREIAERAHGNGGQIMLHLPMEPRGYPDKDPGPGALLSEMSADERISVLKEHLDALPHVEGVNNHMGSKMSEDSAHMNQILSILKKRGLYYIDSLTTPDSRSLSSARLFQVPFAQRDVFIDHVPDTEFIRDQLEKLVNVAREKGSAVGIAHPYPVTWEVLAEELPGLKKKVRLVTASEVVSSRKS